MLLSFIRITQAVEMSADLYSPFYPTEKGRLGFWDIGGASIIEEDVIILAPPMIHHKGAAWSTLPLPYGNWSINFEMKISEGNGGGGFNIMIISTHGADGPHYGGPEVFDGISFVGAVFADKEGKPEIHFKLYQSKGDETHKTLEENTPCDKIFKLTQEKIYITMSIIGDRIIFEYRSDIDDPVEVANVPILINLQRKWLGISAMCDEYTSRIDLYSAKFDTSKYVASRFQESRNHQHIPQMDPHIEPQQKHLLRNPSFAIMRKEIKACKDANGDLNGGEKTADDYFKILGEFAEVLDELAKYSELSNFVGKTLDPYAQQWHRRTFKVVDTVKNANKLMGEALSKTKSLLEEFNETTSHNAKKAEAKIGSIARSVLAEADLGKSIGDKSIDNAAEQAAPKWLSILKYISILEALGVIVFAVVERTSIFKDLFVH